jgi:hypothetical protein
MLTLLAHVLLELFPDYDEEARKSRSLTALQGTSQW